jgi:hypothetical protein
MSAFANPIHILPDGSSTLIERIPLCGGAGTYNERWLQQILFAHPSALPIREIDPHAGELIPVCLELETGAGPADILYVTATGQLVLVETKLWRNAEARRVVVAQILDYAKELSGWTYEDLSRQTAIASKRGPGYLLDCVRACHPGLDEAAFVDGINRSLATGDFILIIAGDGIRHGAESLVSFLERYGNLRFHLALVEAASYRLADGAIVLQPRVLSKTELLARTVFVGAAADIASVKLSSVESNSVQQTAQAAAQAEAWATFWGNYLRVLRLDDIQQPVPARPARTTNLFLYLPPGSACAWISAFVAQSQNEAGVFLALGKGLVERTEWFDRLHEEREAIEQIVPGLIWEKRSDGKCFIQAPPIRIGEFSDPAARLRIAHYLAEQTNQMVNAFRHRLDTMSRERAIA